MTLKMNKNRINKQSKKEYYPLCLMLWDIVSNSLDELFKNDAHQPNCWESWKCSSKE